MAQTLQASQRVRILDLIAEGQIAGLCDVDGNIVPYADRNKGILLDLTPIQNGTGETAISGVQTDFRIGAANQLYINGFPSAEQEVSVEAQVTAGTSIQRSIPAGSHNALKLSLRIPSLYSYDSAGTRSGTSVSFQIDLKRSADIVWETITADSGTIQGETLFPYVRQYRAALKGVGPWDLRVVRLTADTYDASKLQNDTWWQSYTLVTDQKLMFRHSAIGAVEMDAKASQSIRPRAYRIKGSLVRVPSNYNPVTRNYTGVWDGNFAGCAVTLTSDYTAFSAALAVSALASALPNNSPIRITDASGVVSDAYLDGDAAVGATSINISPIPRDITSGASGWGYELKWTNNPAWQFFDLATHKRYGVGQYVPEATVDRWGLYSISRYCDGVDVDGNFVGVDDGAGGVEPRFTCSIYIANAADAYKALSDLASTFRAMIFWGSGLVMAVQDSPKDPQFSFTNANAVEGRFSYSGSARKSRHTIAYVRWNDPDDYYKAKLEQIMGDQADIDRLGSRDITVSAFGCTSRSQAIRVGKWLLLTEKYEQETVTFRGGLEAARCRPGSIIRVRDRNKTVNRMAGRIKSIGTSTIELDAPVVIDTGYSLLVTKDDGDFVDLPITTAPGTYQTVDVTGSLAGISVNATWILRSILLEPTLWRILNVKELDRHIFEVAALKYVEGKFANVESGIEISLPHTTDLPPRTIPAQCGTITITSTTIETSVKTQRTINVSWESAGGNNVRGYRVEYRVPGSEWIVAASIATTLAFSIQVAEAGLYEIRITTLGYYGLESIPKETTYYLVDLVHPDAPTGVSASPGTGKVVLIMWDKVAAASEYAVYRSATNDPATSTKLGEISALSFIDTTMALDTIAYYWVTAISAAEMESDKSASVSATPSSVVGPAGPQGDAGTPGVDGTDGQTSYFHVAYANDITGSTGFNNSGGPYIGTYVDYTVTDSTNPADYAWKKFEGTDGIAGVNGSDGSTSYLHIKYSDDGGTTFTASSGETIGKYIGTYVDFTLADSSTPSDYTWILLQGYVETTPPTDPAAPTLNSSTAYTAGDGTVFSRLVINVPAMPTGGFIMNVLYRKNGSTGWIVADQWDNARNPTPRTSTIDDLSPNISYDVAVQVFTFDLAPSSIVAATGSPFTAPNKSTGPANPTGFAGYAPSSSYPVPPKFWSGTQIYGSTVTFTGSADRDVAYYEWGIGSSSTSAPSFTGEPLEGSANQFFYYSGTLSPQWLWFRTRDRTGNYSAWVYTGLNMNSYLSLAAGSMSSQDSSNVSVSGVKTGSGSSVRQVLAKYDVNMVTSPLTGGAASEIFSLDISNRGFSAHPDLGSVQVESDDNVLGRYLAVDGATSTSTTAYIKLWTRDASNIGASAQYRCQISLTEYA